MIKPEELQEIWKDVPEYKNYQISNFGRVKTKSRKVRYTHAVTGEEHFRHTEERLLKVYLNNLRGYKFVQLRKNGKAKNFTIHRLVAKAFINREPEKNYVNHIDGNKHNNMVENLEWCTNEYNHAHAALTGLKKTEEKLNKTCVYAIKNLLKSKLSHGKIADIFGVSRSLISQIASGNIWMEVLPSKKDIDFSERNEMYFGKKVQLINDSGQILCEWDSIKKAGRSLNIDPSMIGKVARGEYTHYKGNKFKFTLTGKELEVKP